MKADRNQINMFSVDEMVAEATAFLREHEPPEGYYLGFSGGKDSVVCKALAKMAGVRFTAYYSAVGIDPPEVVRFIREYHPDVVFLRPEFTMWDGIRSIYPPLPMRRWCCDHLKERPGRAIPLERRIMGLRAEESSRRAARPRIAHFKKHKYWHYKPIYRWSLYHVWQFIEDYSLPYCSLYDEGFERIGCVVCPFSMGNSAGLIAQRERSMERWPGLWRAYKHACSAWFQGRMDKGFESHWTSFENYWQAYLVGFKK